MSVANSDVTDRPRRSVLALALKIPSRGRTITETTNTPHTMAIANAIQKGSFVYIYDEKGRQLACVGAGSQKGDGLTGYTSSTVNIRKGSFIYSYDEKGRQTGCVGAR